MQQPCISDFRITEDNYQELFDKCAIQKPLGCGASDFNMHIFFFCTFTILMTFVILNLFVAVVLDGFDGSAVGEEETIVQKCMDVWFRHDTDVDLVLKVEKVKKVMEDIEYEFVMEQGWRPLPPHKNKIIKEARNYVHDFIQCENGEVTWPVDSNARTGEKGKGNFEVPNSQFPELFRARSRLYRSLILFNRG